MSRSLIRKNQLHPDISDLVRDYGSAFFFGSENLVATGTILQTQINNLNGSGFATTGELQRLTSFNGNRSVTANIIGLNGLTPGGTDITSFLNNIFYPFVSGSITLNSFATQELGKTTSTINFVGTISSGSLSLNQFTNIGGYINNIARLPLLTPAVQNFNWSVNVDLNTTSTNVYIKSTGVDQNGSPTQIQSNVQSIVFEAPTFVGSGIDNLQNNPANMKLVLSGQNFLGGNNGKTVIQKPSSFQVQVYTNNSWFYIVYPSGWGALSRIANPQLGDFNINTDFTQGFITLTLDNGITTHPYRYYKRSLPTTLTNYPVIYYF